MQTDGSKSQLLAHKITLRSEELIFMSHAVSNKKLISHMLIAEG